MEVKLFVPPRAKLRMEPLVMVSPLEKFREPAEPVPAERVAPEETVVIPLKELLPERVVVPLASWIVLKLAMELLYENVFPEPGLIVREFEPPILPLISPFTTALPPTICTTLVPPCRLIALPLEEPSSVPELMIVVLLEPTAIAALEEPPP